VSGGRVGDIRRHLDLTVGPGLEIGPLHSPIVTRDDADVRYVDVHLTPALKAYYATHPGAPVDDIVEVDYALIEGGRTRTLPEAVAVDAPFAWVVASHVVEHVPDLVGWLADVAEVLADDGVLVLAIPDRRFCFDARRPPTTVGQLLQAHLDGDARPSVRAVFDHFDQAADIDLAACWRGEPTDPARIIHGTGYAWERVVEGQATGEYQDCHVWLFSPAELVAQLATLARLGQLDLALDALDPTPPGDVEFYVALRRVPRRLDAEARRLQVLASFEGPVATEALAAATDPPFDVGTGRPVGDARPGPGATAGTETVEVSPREARAIAAKRRLVGRVRSTVGRLRGRTPSS
jgi:SAM-dependent methyltransferase